MPVSRRKLPTVPPGPSRGGQQGPQRLGWVTRTRGPGAADGPEAWPPSAFPTGTHGTRGRDPRRTLGFHTDLRPHRPTCPRALAGSKVKCREAAFSETRCQDWKSRVGTEGGSQEKRPGTQVRAPSRGLGNRPGFGGCLRPWLLHGSSRASASQSGQARQPGSAVPFVSGEAASACL